MKKIGLLFAVIFICGSLTACAKKINGIKAYQAEIEGEPTRVNGSKNYNHGLIKVTGTSPAPADYDIIAVNSNGKINLVGRNNSMTASAKVKGHKFTGYLDPLKADKDAKKGTKLKYRFIAVKNADNLGQKDQKAIGRQAKGKFKATTIKLNFDPTTAYVETNVQNDLGRGALVAKKSSTVYTITPQKGSHFAKEVAKAAAGNNDQWTVITKKINQLSKRLRTSNGKIALVLINPHNHKKFLFASINGKTRFDAVAKKGSDDNDNDSAAADNESDLQETEADDDVADEDDGDDFEIELIVTWVVEYDEEDDDEYYSDDEQADDDSDYDDSYDDQDDDYDDDQSYDDDTETDQPATDDVDEDADY